MSLEKSDRNRRIYELSKRGGGELSTREIQRIYRFKAVKTVSRIIDREHERVSK